MAPPISLGSNSAFEFVSAFCFLFSALPRERINVELGRMVRELDQKLMPRILFGWHTHSQSAGSNIGGDDGASPDHSPVANANTG